MNLRKNESYYGFLYLNEGTQADSKKTFHSFLTESFFCFRRNPFSIVMTFAKKFYFCSAEGGFAAH